MPKNYSCKNSNARAPSGSSSKKANVWAHFGFNDFIISFARLPKFPSLLYYYQAEEREREKVTVGKKDGRHERNRERKKEREKPCSGVKVIPKPFCLRGFRVFCLEPAVLGVASESKKVKKKIRIASIFCLLNPFAPWSIHLHSLCILAFCSVKFHPGHILLKNSCKNDVG